MSISQSHAAREINYAISVLESWLMGGWASAMKAKSSEQIMRCDFPYTIQPTGDKDTFVVLNRNYQPLGVTVESGLPMEQYKNEFRSQVHFANSNIFTAHDGEAIYLYGSSGNPPWYSK
jgi:hypothetical protein